ncbi:MAG: hypothetical protein HY716_15825 [Planctomycetes bacterium]|nr:hypothetical protein [Planctomycetota bacterium]
MDRLNTLWGAVRVSVAPAFLATVLAGAAPAPVKFTQGGPDTYGYQHIDNINEPAGPIYSVVWQDISSTAAAVNILGAANAWTNVQIPILVRVYGQNWGTPPENSGLTVVGVNVEISANGFVALLAPGQADPSPGLWVNQNFPSNDNRIGPGGFCAVLWDDWGARGANDAAPWEVIGTAPNRRFGHCPRCLRNLCRI